MTSWDSLVPFECEWLADNKSSDDATSKEVGYDQGDDNPGEDPDCAIRKDAKVKQQQCDLRSRHTEDINELIGGLKFKEQDDLVRVRH